MAVERNRLLLIGWDAAEWAVIRPLASAGLMPHFTRLLDEGISGDLAAPRPLVSPVAWTSMVTGKRAWQHGVLGHSEVAPDGLDVRPVGSHSHRARPIWNLLSDRGLRTRCVNAYASAPADAVNGMTVSKDAFAPGAPAAAIGAATYPSALASELASLMIRPDELDDELLRFLLPAIDAASESTATAPWRVQLCREVLANAASVQAVACHLLESEPWNFAAVFYAGLERVSHACMRFHPPRQPDLSDAEFALCQHAVAGTYRLHDLMLGRLVELAGPDARVMVVSDHGFVTGSDRAGTEAIRTMADAVARHRSPGIFALRGPGVKADDTIEGASLLDVTPTILQMFGLPTGADMDGKPLADAFVEATAATFVTSWDGPGAPRPAASPPSVPADPSIAYLLDLGYREPPTADAVARMAAVREENDHHLAQSLIDGGRHAEAIDLLRPLAQAHPANVQFAKSLFESYLAAGRTAEARAVVQRAWGMGYPGALQHVAFAMVDLAERRPDAAREHLRVASATGEDQPDLKAHVGRMYVALQRWDEAEAAFLAELDRRPDHALALAGRAVVALHRRRFADAVEHARRAVRLRPDLADAHLVRGIALSHLGQPREAATSLWRTASLDPSRAVAYRHLAKLYAGPLDDSAEAQRLDRLAMECRLRRLRPTLGFNERGG